MNALIVVDVQLADTPSSLSLLAEIEALEELLLEHRQSVDADDDCAAHGEFLLDTLARKRRALREHAMARRGWA